MRKLLALLMLTALTADAFAANPPLTEALFKSRLGFGADVKMVYRGLDCEGMNFAGFAQQMADPNVHADVDRAASGKEITMTARRRGAYACPAPYPPITVLPPFDLRDLAGKRVTAASLKGKPTLINFFFSTCVPCILEVQPLNEFAAARPKMNFLAVTFDEAAVAHGFVERFGFRWRVVPDARDFIDRVRVKNYPMMALFDANGRLLGTRKGGARDPLEAANVGPQLQRWMDGLMK